MKTSETAQSLKAVNRKECHIPGRMVISAIIKELKDIEQECEEYTKHISINFSIWPLPY